MRGICCFLRNIVNRFSFLFPFIQKLLSKSFTVQIEDMVYLVSRTGRHLQRYRHGCRQVVGCIPYRFRTTNEPSSTDGTCVEKLEVLLISSQSGKGMLFPKGGWEKDESMEEAALRETIEEAGVMGNVGCKLGQWRYKSKTGGKMHEVYMFSLQVQKQLELWPEHNIRKRKWVTVDEAKELCQNWWMREALDELVRRQTQLQQRKDETVEIVSQ